MSDIAINPVTRRVQFTGNTGTGPYAFTFNILVDGDIAVFKGTTELTLTTDYTVSINANGTGSITLTVALIASDVLTIIGGRELSRTTDFVTAGDLLASSLNEQLDSNVIMTQQLDEKLGRGLFVNPGDVFTDLELPLKDDRKGTVLGFNATTGDPEPGPEIADVDSLASISADIKTLAEIQDGTVATDAITNVNTIRANVTTVSNISGNVTTVAGISSDVTTVAADGADIGTVAGISSDVTTVSGISANVTSVAGNASNINTVAADGADIGTVAASIADVNTAADNITEIQNASANAATATTQAGVATTQAGIATTKASEASTSSATATTQAGISTTKAAESAASAAAALASENAAATSESNASISESNASNSATLSEASRIASVAAQAAAETAETNAETAQTAAEAAQTAAETAETNAATSETNAANSAASASTDAGTATTKAGEAAASATASANSATASEAAKDAALAALDNFDDRYLGAKASDPTVDNDGNPLVSGALYFNTTDDVMKVYDGSQWLAAYASLSGALLVNNNLSDVADAAASRTNLGLGTGNTPTFAGINTTGNLSFGDNDKAIFGAGSDLQIYHDGSDSIISESASGNLLIQGDNLYLQNPAGSSTYIRAKNGLEVDLRYNGSPKLATTSTGIDVTGTVTADGLTVDGEGTFTKNQTADTAVEVSNLGTAGANTTSSFIVSETVGTPKGWFRRYRDGTGTTAVGFSDKLVFEGEIGSTPTNRMEIASNGDLSLYEDTGTTPKFFWDASAESLGLFNSTTGYTLDLDNSGTGEQKYLSLSSGATIVGDINRPSGTNDIELNANYGGIAFGTGTAGTATERMRITSSGNVGIGTSSPAQKLHVNGGQYTGLRLETTNALGASYIDFGDNSDGDVGGIVYWHTDNSMRFVANASERMRIDSSGNLLVGKTGANSNLTGVQAISDGRLFATTSGSYALVGNRLSSDGDIALFQKDGSTVGSIGTSGVDLTIGTNDVGLKFNDAANRIDPWNVTTNTAVDGAFDLGKTDRRFKDLYLSGTANAANFNTTSDATLKTNVETLTGSLDAVKSLRGVSFDWLENGNSEVGVIAQEVEAVLPDVVSTNDQGIKSVKYGNMVALLIEAMKEQQLRIEALEAKLGE